MIELGDGVIHPSDEMTSRQRLLAAYRREAVDRLPFWAKVTNETWRRNQPDEVRRMSNVELLDYIHADGLFHAPRCVEISTPRAQRTETTEGSVRTIVTETPDGDLVERWSTDATTGSVHPTEFPVKTVEDLKRFRWLYERQVRPSQPQIADARRQADRIGQRGITMCSWGTSPLMHLIEHVIGPAETVFFLTDHPDETDELIDAMHRANVELVQCVAEHAPADAIVSVENTSTSLLSPWLFEKYCHSHLCEYGRIIAAEGKMHELHMCGLLKALLERIDTIPASSIEAFTSPPLANTRLVDGKTLAPSKTLVGGTCVNVWWRKDVEAIKRYIQWELEACPDHRGIVLTTAGVAPPACSAETFREVGQWIATVGLRQ